MTDKNAPTDTRSTESKGRVQAARARVGETAHSARTSMEQNFRKARTTASSAFSGAKDGARRAADKTASTVETAPLAVLIGGLAVGAIAGGLLPRTQREADVLAPVGKRVKGTATAAARAAKTAGQDQLRAAGISRDTAKSQLQTVIEGVLKAVSEAGNAATAEVKRTPKV